MFKPYVKELKNAMVRDPWFIITEKRFPKNGTRPLRILKTKPNCRFFVGTPHTGGYGLTLISANTVIYYSNGYDLEKRMQSEDRAHRIGQKFSVTYVDIIAEETVDQKIVRSLRKKT